ncbi:MAG: LCP family protein [Clostridia bacterium]|nr:LCP family protein [Clostridia bacterium]
MNINNSSAAKPNKRKPMSIKKWFRTVFVPFFMKEHKRNLKAAVAIVSCFAVLFFITAVIYANRVLDGINYGDGYGGNADATFDDVVEEDLNYSSMFDVTDAESLKELLKSWATNDGIKMHSRNVINVLLIGEDNDEESHRSDSMMLVSLNKKTKQIYLTSFLRDSYTYMDINGSERYDKTNHSYSWGGTKALIETLQNNYKIEIDHYVTVNFAAFRKAINAVGGIDVPVTEKEAKFMNDTTHFDDFKSGSSVHMDGAHALIFSRIRHLDGEVERTDRQKLVIKALISKAKTLSVSELTALCDKILPLVSTDYSKLELVTLGTQALSRGWADYPLTSQTEPEESLREGVTMNTWSYSNLLSGLLTTRWRRRGCKKPSTAHRILKLMKRIISRHLICSPRQIPQPTAATTTIMTTVTTTTANTITTATITATMNKPQEKDGRSDGNCRQLLKKKPKLVPEITLPGRR